MEQPQVLKYSSNSRVIFFEEEKELPNGFIEAKKYMNSVFLEHGRFEEYIFNKGFVHPASEGETDMYVALKERSVHLIGKT